MTDYDIMYDLFLAEDRLYKSFIDSGSIISLLKESDERAITEALNDKVNDYVNNVMESAQSAWNNFKKAVGTEEQRKFLTSNVGKIKAADNVSFQINNYPDFDITKINGIPIQIFQFERMKDQLTSVDRYVKAYYPQYYSMNMKGLTGFKKNIKTSCIKYDNVVCDKKLLVESYNYALNGYMQTRKYLENNINTINTSADNINKDVSTVVTTSHEAAIIFNEADAAGSRIKKMSFSQYNGGDPNKDNNGNQKHYKFLDSVVVYMKVSMAIISTKMKMLNNLYDTRYKIVEHFVDKDKEVSSSDKKKQVKQIDV